MKLLMTEIYWGAVVKESLRMFMHESYNSFIIPETGHLEAKRLFTSLGTQSVKKPLPWTLSKMFYSFKSLSYALHVITFHLSSCLLFKTFVRFVHINIAVVNRKCESVTNKKSCTQNSTQNCDETRGTCVDF